MHIPSMILSSAALAGLAGAAAVAPRQNLDNVIFPLPEPVPVDNFNKRLPVPEGLTWTVQEIMDAGGNATEAAPSANMANGAGPLDVRQLGADGRTLNTNTAYPFGAMGRVRIEWPGVSSWCSGSLVGARVVVMARHCLHSGASYRFQPAYYNSERLGGFDVTRTINVAGENGDNGGCGWKDDWALLILNRAPNLGFLGFRYFADSMSNANLDWWNYGYPQDKSSNGQLPYSQNRFKMWKTTGCGSSEGGSLEGNYHNFGGQSGGPVWIPESDGRYQYGVNVGYVPGVKSLASHGGTLINAIIRARNDFP